MTEQPKAKGGEHGGKARIEGFRENPSIPAITLAQAGIDKNLAHRAVCLTKSAAQSARLSVCGLRPIRRFEWRFAAQGSTSRL